VVEGIERGQGILATAKGWCFRRPKQANDVQPTRDGDGGLLLSSGVMDNVDQFRMFVHTESSIAFD